jgi:putative ABC transport system permease protein
MLRRNPGLTFVVMATLALVIGLNTAIFSVVHTAPFRPIAYPAADRLVWLGEFSERERRDIHVGRGAYLAWRDQARSFEAMAAYGNDELALVSSHDAGQESIASITGDFWSTTGAQPALEHLFRESEADTIV